MSRLTHLDDAGCARMVDVGQKETSSRFARAQAVAVMQPETLQLILAGACAKGDVLAVARVAGIMAVKRTSDLIPLCHPLAVDSAEVEFEPLGQGRLRITTAVRSTGRTGVEMEALTAAAVAGLTIYDMCKSVDREMTVTDVRLLEKSGGKSGHFLRESGPEDAVLQDDSCKNRER